MKKILVVGNWKMHISANADETNLRFFSSRRVRNESVARAALFPEAKAHDA